MNEECLMKGSDNMGQEMINGCWFKFVRIAKFSIIILYRIKQT